MNTNNLKRFAQETRRKLLEQVSSRLTFILNADTVLLREKTDQIKQLREELNRTPKEQLIEKVAYTWFNRLMALRFMDANDYQPLGLRIITPKDGYTIPELLDEAKKGNISEELRVDSKRVFALLYNEIPSSNPQNEAYKELLIAACNHLNSVLPFLFERINDYTELLLPEDLTSDFSVVTDIRNGMIIEDCRFVEIIGWLYQFYISEKKDEVFATKAKIKKEDIPAATQLFTPRWIVEYMVQNTLGKLWLQNRPNSRLREFMPYFIESEPNDIIDSLKIVSPEEIRLADPASGSGHILVYSFDLFTKIYEEEGYNSVDIPKLIIEKNLFGFEIDDRAAQLSGFSLMMKAREYNRKAFKYEILPNIICFKDLSISDKEINSTVNLLNIKVSNGLLNDLKLMQQATNLGSLILPSAERDEIINVISVLTHSLDQGDMFYKITGDSIVSALRQLSFLTMKFHCIAANPPYMGDSNYNKNLSEFIYKNYPESKLDLMTCFMEAGIETLVSGGYLGMINQHSWMFISSYKELRKKLFESICFKNMLHLGTRVFPEIGGEVVQNTSFTLQKFNKNNNITTYIRLVEFDSTERKRDATIEVLKHQRADLKYKINQENFKLIPNYNVCYWFSDRLIENFKNEKIGNISIAKAGIVSGIDSDFLRLWFEVTNSNISFKETKYNTNLYFVPINKGGGIRKYFGNEEYIINIHNLWKDGRTGKSVRRGDPSFYFKEAITWTMVCGTSFSFRYSVHSTFATAAPAIFLNSEILTLYTLGFLNSKIASLLLSGFNPTINLGSGDVSRLPVKQGGEITEILRIVKENVAICKEEWDSRETSWNFSQNELIRISGQDIEEKFDLFKLYWKNKFFLLHKNEQVLNEHYINTYGLSEELSATIPYEDITILKEETEIKDGKLIFKSQEVFKQFISFSVGCMFGRYSLDQKGIIIANEGETLREYHKKISKEPSECTFLPDEDNIIPILEDEWFTDDIVSRFYQFLKATLGVNNFNKNLAFIEEQLGKDIRKYFIRDFYADHIKRYKKRPIYWMFSSANGSFNVLIYMHRYTPDTVNNILNKYLREFINKLKTRKEHLIHVSEVGSPAEKIKAIKEMDTNEKRLIELRDYERDIIYPLAIERIPIDLDDGVLVNYNKFGKAVKEVAGLNDKKTKEAVRKFDWIDTSQIR